DLEALQDQKLVKRIYGGAILADPAEKLEQYASRISESHAEKSLIGQAAAKLINTGETILLDIGTTTLEIARHIKHMNNITVLTNSLPIMNELAGSNINLFSLGGRVNPDELSMFGKLTVDALQNFFVDKAFIGAGGVTFNGGLSDYNSEEAQVRQFIINRASQTILVADSNKFGINAFAVVCPLEKIDVIVSDDNLPKTFADGIRERKIELILAKSNPAEQAREVLENKLYK
ncbi:MAG: DeoR/GlpR family DNA-binding transcription regulator, partial [Clostridiales bacterium]|nr:DeoR/GlpR family DNA-binding transcription regulator [Clostridiales bacterium]